MIKVAFFFSNVDEFGPGDPVTSLAGELLLTGYFSDCELCLVLRESCYRGS